MKLARIGINMIPFARSELRMVPEILMVKLKLVSVGY